MKPVVIVSGTVNRYGFRLLPEGGKLDAYKKNPVLLYDHGSDPEQGKIPIGTVINLGIVNGVLVGTPVFDQKDPFAKRIEQKWEDNILNASSVGFDPMTLSDAPEFLLAGQTRSTVTEWEGLEISITPIPGDRDAVKLNLQPGQTIDDVIPLLKLSLDKKSETMNNPLAVKLGLPATATDAEVDAKIAELTKAQGDLASAQLSAQTARIDKLIEVGKLKGVVNDDNESPYRKLAAADYESAEKLVTVAAAKKGNNTTEDADKRETLSMKELIDGVTKANQGGEQAKPQDTFEYLSKHAPATLNEIRVKDPEKYAKLAADYASRPAQSTATV